MNKPKNRFLCPVCGYAELSLPPENYNICACCSTCFAKDDNRRSHADLRAMWIEKGKSWRFAKYRPENWNAETQLKDAEFDEDLVKVTSESHYDALLQKTLATRHPLQIQEFPRPGKTSNTHIPWSWQEAEDQLVELLTAYAVDPLGPNRNLVAYGFSIECHSKNAKMFGYTNVQTSRYNQSATYPSSHPKRLGGWTVEQLKAAGRFANRDWAGEPSFCSFVSGKEEQSLIDSPPEWIREAETNAERHQRAFMFGQHFMVLACRVAIRLEQDDAFGNLKKTDDFRVLCMDVNEPLILAEERLHRVRQEFRDN